MEQRQSPAGDRQPSPKIQSRLIALCAVIAAMLSAACSYDKESSQYWNFGNSGWPYADTLVYEVDTTAIADIGIVVRHAAEYEYSNLWIELAYLSDTRETRTDTFEIVLADDFGRWRGHGLGVGLQYADTLLRSVSLQDSSRLCLRQIMRSDTVKGIEQIGIILNF